VVPERAGLKNRKIDEGADMKKILSAVAAIVLSVSGVTYAGEQDFVLVNDTGVDIAGVYISAASVDNWEENMLADDEVLPAGNEVEVNFAPEEESELWDIKVVDGEGASIVWTQLKLTEIHRVTLKLTDGSPIAELE
jgi:hypothetical protein